MLLDFSKKILRIVPGNRQMIDPHELRFNHVVVVDKKVYSVTTSSKTYDQLQEGDRYLRGGTWYEVKMERGYRIGYRVTGTAFGQRRIDQVDGGHFPGSRKVTVLALQYLRDHE